MSEELERMLSRTLRPVDPGEDFTTRVMAQVSATPHNPRTHSRLTTWIPLGLAASVILVVAGTYEWQQRQKEAGLAARAQVLEALRVTSEKLDLAYRLINTSSRPASDRDPGA
jgi:predicted hotdog family 3-hydroxylacyl-ACP dehydratase